MKKTEHHKLYSGGRLTCIHLPPETIKKIDEIAQKEYRSRHNLMKHWIISRLEEEEKNE